jgi:hypothetical protein
VHVRTDRRQLGVSDGAGNFTRRGVGDEATVSLGSTYDPQGLYGRCQTLLSSHV